MSKDIEAMADANLQLLDSEKLRKSISNAAKSFDHKSDDWTHAA